MGVLAFIASIVGSLAAPAAAVVLGLVFRKPLRTAFTNLAERMKDVTRFRTPVGELDFRETVLQVSAEVQAAVDSSPTGSALGSAADTAPPALPSAAEQAEPISGHPDPGTIYDRYDKRARAIATASYATTPEVTVINAWALLEDAIRELARLMNITDRGSLADLTTGLIRALDKAELLSHPEHTSSAVQNLLGLKLRVTAGAAGPTRADAAVYQDTAFEVAQILIRAYLAYTSRPTPQGGTSAAP
jgi:hypothetical protein